MEPNHGSQDKSSSMKTQSSPASNQATIDNLTTTKDSGPAQISNKGETTASDVNPKKPERNPFRANGQILSNHFSIGAGNVSHLFEYPVAVVQTFPPSSANQSIPRRMKRRVIYLFIEQLTRGAVAPVPPPADPPSAQGPPAAGDQAEQGKKSSNSKTTARAEPPPFSSATLVPVLPNAQIASDYHDLLVTVSAIPANAWTGITYDVLYYEDWAAAPRTNCKRFGLTITSETRLSLAQMSAYLANPGQILNNGVNAFAGTRDSTLRALNIIFCNHANLATFRDRPRQRNQTSCNIGSKNFYDLRVTRPPVNTHTAPWPVSAGIEALPGFFMSARAPLHGSLLLNMNTTTSAFYEPRNLNYLINRLGTHNLPLLQYYLRKLRVQTNYLNASSVAQGRGPRDEICHTITGLPDTMALPTAGNTMISVNETQISVRQYFNQTHQIVVNVATNDIVVSLGRQVIPARYLEVLHGSPVKQKTDMVQHAARPPTANFNLINGPGKVLFALNQNSQTGPAARFNGMNISQNMLMVNASFFKHPPIGYRRRVMPHPEIRVAQHHAQNGAWNLSDFRFTTPSPGGRWTFLELSGAGTAASPGGTSSGHLNAWFDEVSRQLPRYGIGSTGFRFAHSPPAEDQSGRHKLFLTGDFNIDGTKIVVRLQNFLNAQRQSPLGPLKLFFILLPAREAALYSLVKRISDLHVGVRTICHVCKWNKKGAYWGPSTDPGLLGNLFMKFNLKMHPSGVNQKLLEAVPILTEDTMLIGLDVTHPGVGSLEGAPSIAAIVGSVEPSFAQFPAILRSNARLAPVGDHTYGLPNEEITALADMVYQSLRNRMNHRANHPNFPDKIIVFRDGLSEAQFDMCRTRELPRIQEGIQQLINQAKNDKALDFQMPQVMLICTVKRHHTRFFRDGSNAQHNSLFDNQQNPMPGCLVDNTVTLGNNEDFYLFSHKAIQGTSKPTHYVVLHNDMNASIRDIAEMTHALCYLYQRATRSVSLAPPSYYADLAADRARLYARNVYNPARHAVYNPQQHQMHLSVAPQLQMVMNYI